MQPDDCERHTAVRIVIVDDHLMFRRGVRAVLETYAEQVDVIGEAATANDAVALVADRVPDLVLLDLQPARALWRAQPAGLGAWRERDPGASGACRRQHAYWF